MIAEWGHNRHRRAKVLKLPRRLNGAGELPPPLLFSSVNKGSHTQTTETFVEIESLLTTRLPSWIMRGTTPTFASIGVSTDGEPPITRQCSWMGIGIDHPLSSLHFYGRSHDWEYLSGRFNLLKSIPLPHAYRGRVHGPQGLRVDYAYHILCKGSPSGNDFAFWDNNEGLNYWRELR